MIAVPMRDMAQLVGRHIEHEGVDGAPSAAELVDIGIGPTCLPSGIVDMRAEVPAGNSSKAHHLSSD